MQVLELLNVNLSTKPSLVIVKAFAEYLILQAEYKDIILEVQP
jgi:hypothetical protein